MCSQHNVRASAGDSTGQNIDKGQTSNPRIGIKIPDPTENRSRAGGLEGRDSTDHDTATNVTKCNLLSYIYINLYLLNYLIYPTNKGL